MRLSNIEILYIEDNRANMQLIQSFFSKRHDIMLHSAITAQSGIQLAMEKQPDLILMDIKLPDISGYEALTELRCHEKTASIPVIAVSANAHKSQIKAGMEAGFYRYLTKPLNLYELEETIFNALNIELTELTQEHSTNLSNSNL